jgi:hypothetical protein
MNGSDLAHQVMPWLQVQAGEIRAGRMPWWSPYEWGGQNLLGQGQPGVVNPLNWLLFAIPLRRGWIREGALQWWFFLIHYIAALNLYFLVRSLGTGRLAAIFGGLTFALLGFLGSNDWPQMLCGIIWAPLVFLFLLRAHRGETPLGSLAAASFFYGLSWLSGHHQQPIFLSLALAGSIVFLRYWRGTAIFALGGMIAAAQLLPGLEYGRLAKRWVGMNMPVGWQDKVAYYVHEHYANYPSSLLGILLPGKESNMSVYLGATALALALYTLQAAWMRREVKLFLMLGLGSLLYTMARFGGVEPLFYSLLPLVEKARTPAMAGSIFTMSFAVLAALGIEYHKRNPAAKLALRVHWGFGGVVLGLFLLSQLGKRSDQQLEERWLSAAFASILAGWAYFAVSRGQLAQRTLYPLLLAAMLVESANMTYFNAANRHDPNVTNYLAPMSRHLDTREFLATLPGPVRVTVDSKEILYNYGDWHGVEVLGGYLASISRNLMDVDLFSERGLRLAGVGYHVGPTARGEGSTAVFDGSHGIRVWKYAHDPLPRAWVATSVLAYRSTGELQQFLETDTLDLARTALVSAANGVPSGLAGCAGGRAVVLRRVPNEVVVQANTECRGLLVLGETDDPGWSVTVEGRPAAKVTAYGIYRAVVVEKGLQTVRFRYTPPGLRLGATLSAGGILVALGLIGWERRRLKIGGENLASL